MSSSNWIKAMLIDWGEVMSDGGRSPEIGILHKVMELGPMGAAIKSSNFQQINVVVPEFAEKVSESIALLPKSYSAAIMQKYLVMKNCSNERVAKSLKITPDALRHRLSKSFDLLWPMLEKYRQQFESV